MSPLQISPLDLLAGSVGAETHPLASRAGHEPELEPDP
jgi:hypothetical protein